MIEFIELKAQRAHIKDEIDAGIQRVMEHGQYIQGPLNKRPAVADLSVKLSIGEEVSDQVPSLPMYPYLSSKDQDYVAAYVKLSLQE